MAETAQVLFDPAELPYGGQISALSPLSVGPGKWILGQNIDPSDGTIRARWGLVKTGSAPVAVGAAATATSSLGTTAFCIGADAVTCNGTVYAISAWRTTGGPSGTWIVVTDLSAGTHAIANSASGQWGDTTAISTATFTPVTFHVLADPRGGKEYIVIVGDVGMGIYDPASGAQNFAGVADVAPAGDSSGFSSIATLPVFFTVNDQATTTYAASGGSGLTGADTGTSPDNTLRFTMTTGGATGDNATVTFAATKDLSACRQIILVFDSTMGSWWEQCKLSIKEGGAAASVVWDPASSVYRYELVPVWNEDAQTRINQTKAAIAFSLDHIPAASRNAVDGIVLTWSGSPPTGTNRSMDVYMIAGSGVVPGQSYHALTYFDPASRIESKPIFPKVQPELIRNLGGPTLSGLRLPNSEKLFYNYTVGFQNLAAASQVSQVLIYRNDPGDPDPSRYSYVVSQTINAYSAGPGTWGFSSGTALSILSYSDAIATDSRDRTIVAPFPGCKPPPIRNFCAATANGRFLCGEWVGTGSYGAPTFSRLKISELDNPFRFYDAPYRGDKASGGVRKFQSEVLYSIHKMSGDLAGVDSLWYFTDKNQYRTSNFSLFGMLNPGFVSEHGTKYPGSVASYKGTMYWVDQDQNVLKLGGEFQNLSRYVVDNYFSTLLPASSFLINNAQGFKISSRFYKNKYRMAFDTVGTDTVSSMRMTKNLVYHEKINGWSVDAYSNSLNTQFIFEANGNLYAWGSDRFLYTLENGSQATDGGTAFNVSLTTGMIHDGFKGLAITKCVALVDDAASGTASWTATYMPDGSTRTSGAKSIDASTSYVLRNLRVTQGGTGKGMGPAVQIAFTFVCPGGTRIYGITAYFEPRSFDAANV